MRPFAFSVLVVVALVFAIPAVAWAQCGANTSECRACHGQPNASRWHRDHAFADLCAQCHGGDANAKDAAAAHAGMRAPLADVATTCGACHADARTLAASYDVPPPPPSPPPGAKPPPSHPRSAANALFAALAVVLGASFLAVVTRWRPRGAYGAGALLGVVTTISMAVFGKRLSGAGAYQHLSGYIGRLLDPDGVYWRFVVPTGMTWEVWMLVGTFLGALASALVAREFAVRTMPDTQWADIFGPSVARRWLVVFAGTMVLEYAAGIAGGCTASLAVSGGAVLAPAAFLFMAGMFAGGIPVALFLYRRRRS